MIELLAPAGSMEGVLAAVQSGANAVYMGYGDFNARRNAKNFTTEEFVTAVDYCHLRGVKVYLTLNTLVTDRELPQMVQAVEAGAQAHVDAMIIQDLGVLRLLRQVCPDMEIHGSTQMSVHSLDGVKTCADLGISRVVLARELNRAAIDTICTYSPIELEIFAHGALCMCYSGQCFFSSVIGGRSGNRGLCAQPCRLNYGWKTKADGYPLSLKDLSLIHHLQDLKKLRVAALKIEGRMKRPEYVSIVTGIYARALREGGNPTPNELIQLESAFSRQGFTDGYYTNEVDNTLFGIRDKRSKETSESKETKELFAKTRAFYQEGERRQIPITFYAMVQQGTPIQVGIQDDMGRTATATGEIPQPARNRPLTSQVVHAQLSRTGGTPYTCKEIRSIVDPDLALPVAAFNALRRQLLAELSQKRIACTPYTLGSFQAGVRYENHNRPLKVSLSLSHVYQLTQELLERQPHIIYLPLQEAVAHAEHLKTFLETANNLGTLMGVTLPRIIWDAEGIEVEQQLQKARKMGFTQAMVGHMGHGEMVKRSGFLLRGDFGLGVFNSQSLKEYKRLGFASLTPSFELKLAQIRDLSKGLDVELLAYGRLPLMITEPHLTPPEESNEHSQASYTLIDRKREKFPVVPAFGGRSEILNGKKLFLADKAKDYQQIGLWGIRLLFTTETPQECLQTLERYQGQGHYSPHDITRGLYFRDVE